MDRQEIEFVRGALEEYRLFFEDYLSSSVALRKKGVPQKLHEAMEYSLNAGGKRVRPALCIAAAERCGCLRQDALPMALGIEMLHTATLIHDDLPCMDDDDLRRGKPSNHAVFGETLAVLAGDALLAMSVEFPLANSNNIKPQRLIRAMQIFTGAIGPSGVCGGQVLDMDTSQAAEDPDYVRHVAELKTGALIRASVLSGAALGSEDEQTLCCYYDYGTHLGAAFQIVDDILDVTSSAKELGKTPGKDKDQGKINYVLAFGLEGARRIAFQESALAKESVAKILPEDDFLVRLPDYLAERTH